MFVCLIVDFPVSAETTTQQRHNFVVVLFSVCPVCYDEVTIIVWDSGTPIPTDLRSNQFIIQAALHMALYMPVCICMCVHIHIPRGC